MSCSETYQNSGTKQTYQDSETEELRKLYQITIETFCAAMAAEQSADGASKEEIAEIDRQMRQGFLDRYMVIVKDDQNLQTFMQLDNSYNDYKNLYDRFSKRFICTNLTHIGQVLVFLPLGWSCTEQPDTTLLLLDDKNRTRGSTRIADDGSGEYLELDTYYEIETRPSEDSDGGNVLDVVEVKTYEGECIASFAYTTEMALSHISIYTVVDEAYTYLEQNYPHWRNPAAYWDD